MALLKGRGIHLLQTAKAAMHQDGYELYRPQLVVSLAEGLAKAGQLDAAHSAMIELANVPINDKFHIVTRHSADEIIYPEE